MKTNSFYKKKKRGGKNRRRAKPVVDKNETRNRTCLTPKPNKPPHSLLFSTKQSFSLFTPFFYSQPKAFLSFSLHFFTSQPKPSSLLSLHHFSFPSRNHLLYFRPIFFTSQPNLVCSFSLYFFFPPSSRTKFFFSHPIFFSSQPKPKLMIKVKTL